MTVVNLAQQRELKSLRQAVETAERDLEAYQVLYENGDLPLRALCAGTEAALHGVTCCYSAAQKIDPDHPTTRYAWQSMLALARRVVALLKIKVSDHAKAS